MLQMEKVNCPEELISYKTELKSTYETLILGLKLEIDYMQTNNKNSLNECKKQYKAYNESNESKFKLVNDILDKNGVKHN